MAVLTAEQLTLIRQACAADAPAVNYTKAQINAALQAIENVFDGDAPILRAEIAVAGTPFKQFLAGRIDAATAPFVFTNPQKQLIARFWLRSKFERGG